MINNRIVLTAFLLFSGGFAWTQVKFTGSAFSIGTGPDALLNMNAVSSYATPVEGLIRITVIEERSSEAVLSMNINPAVVLSPGINNMTRFRSQSAIQYYENELGRIAKTSGAYAPGDYMICYRFIPKDQVVHGTETENCFFNSVIPKVPLELITPEDTICITRPPFIWHGRKTRSPNVAFRIICAEIKEGQMPAEALVNNTLLVNEAVFQQQNQIAFPSGTPGLIEGKKYAWQVMEVAGNTILNTSSTAEFAVGCGTTEKAGPESFAEVKQVYTGKRYFFTSSVNFSFNNPYAARKLRYSITHVATKKKVTNLPDLMMNAGLNKISLLTEDLRGLVKGEEYKMEIYNLGNAIHYINFIIKE